MTVAQVHDAEVRTTRSSRRSVDVAYLLIALVPGLVFMALFVWRSSSNPSGRRRLTLFDDAMISMTYARTFADTGELVWFPGADRVQGFTNPLWTLYMALLHRVGWEGSSAVVALTLTSMALIIAVAVVAFVVVIGLLPDHPRRRLFAAIAAGTVALCYPLVFWGLRGMEVVLLALVLLIVVGGSPVGGRQRRPALAVTATVAGVVGVLTRLDVVVPIIAVGIACAATTPTRRDRARVVALGAAPAVAAAAVVLTLQELYYGEWLPNTYLLKVAGVSWAERLERGLTTSGPLVPFLALVVVATVVVRARGDHAARDRAVVMLSAIAAVVAYNVWVGGDAWGSRLFNRFVTTIVPLGIVLVVAAAALIGHGAARSTPRRPVIVGLSAALAILLVASAGPTVTWWRAGGLHVDDDQHKTEQAQALTDATTADAIIATMWAGAPAYYSERPMIDLLGKSDPVIAAMTPVASFRPGHNKWDYDYSIRVLRPDVVFEPWTTARDIDDLRSWGYVPRCVLPTDQNPSYFRTDSDKVIWSELTPCA